MDDHLNGLPLTTSGVGRAVDGERKGFEVAEVTEVVGGGGGGVFGRGGFSLNSSMPLLGDVADGGGGVSGVSVTLLVLSGS